jgi:hypothetical protein
MCCPVEELPESFPKLLTLMMATAKFAKMLENPQLLM